MPKFIVAGAERESGDLVEFEIEADSPAHAERLANARGVLVQAVRAPAERVQPEPAARPERAPKGRRKRLRIPLCFTIAIGIAGGLLAAETTLGVFRFALLLTNAESRESSRMDAPTSWAGRITATRLEIPQPLLAAGPIESGDGSPAGVRILRTDFDFRVEEWAGDTVRAAWELRLSNDTGVTQTVRIAPAIIDQAGDEIWRAARGYQLAVPPGMWTYRDAMTVTVRSPFGSVFGAYYRW